MSDKERLKEIEDTYNEAYPLWSNWFIKAKRDNEMVLSKQWSGADLAKLKKENRPPLVINLMKKTVAQISGFQRQNPMDINYLPVEGTDQEHADIYTETVKWVFTNGGGSFSRSLAFYSTVRTGLGWLAPEMNYDEDPLYGDINIPPVSIFEVMPDPYMVDPRLKDCTYMLRFKSLSKDRVMSLYPKYESGIKSLNSKNSSKFNQESRRVTDKQEKLYVIEKWYRVYEKESFLYNPMTDKTIPWEKTEKEFEQRKIVAPVLNNYVFIKKRVPKIKLMTSVNDELLVYDGDAPEGLSKTKYPFIPIFGDYMPDHNDSDWQDKLQGFVRVLIDSQDELNKSRSVLMDALMTNVHSGVEYEEGAVDNPSVFNKGGAGQIIKYKPGGLAKSRRIDPPRIDAALAQLEQMHKSDIREMGINPDLLGITGDGGTAASASGVSLQTRVKQGLTSLQNYFDNLSESNKMLGAYMIDLINLWPKEKIERIINKPLPADWDDVKESAKYDITIDEKTSSSTYRQSIFFDMQSLVQHGVQIPQPILREAMDLPTKIKEKWNEIDQQNTEQQQQMQQMQMQIEQQKLQIEIQKEQIKAQTSIQEMIMKIQGQIDVAQIKSESDQEIAMKKNINNLAVAKIELAESKNYQSGEKNI